MPQFDIRPRVEAYLAAGLEPIPLDPRKKGTHITGWPTRKFTLGDFAPSNNVGLRLGVDRLTDLDLDCSEAIILAPDFLPDTGFKYGRKTARASHWIVRLNRAVPSIKLIDPVIGNKKGLGTIIELRCTKEDGTIGLQSVAPGSIHEDTGELIEFESGASRVIHTADADAVVEAVNRIAAITLLVRYFPAEGAGRNDALLAIAGTLARAGWSEADAIAFNLGIYRLLWGGAANRTACVSEVRATFAKHANGSKLYGIPKLKGKIDARVVSTALEWLGIGASFEFAAAAAFAEPEPETAPPTGATAATAGAAACAAFNPLLGLKVSLGEAVKGLHRFARDRGGDLYIYRDGVYQRDAADTIRQQIVAIIGAWGMAKDWKKSLGDEVEEYVRLTGAPRLEPRPPMDCINVLNGLLDIKTGQLRPHTPEFLSPVQIKIHYDPDATCPAWERYLDSTFDKELLPLIWQVIGWLFTPDTSAQKAVLLVGAGGNGKSVFLDALTAMLGRENVSAKSLHQLEDDRFACADLYGRLANICADLPNTELKSSSMFKAIVTGDLIDAQRKNQHPFQFHPFARLVFSANSFPRSSDSSDGFFRRWLVIPFEKAFHESEERRNKCQLDAELQAPGELSGVLNMAIRALGNFRMFGFKEPKKVAEAGRTFRETTDPLSVWFDLRVKKGAESRILTKELLFAFNNEVSRPRGQSFMTAHAMTKFLKSKGIEKKESDGYYYAGIELRLV